MGPVAYKERIAVEEPRMIPAARPKPVPMPTRPLFSDSLLESNVGVNRRRRWTTAASFIIQAILLCIAVLIPLIYTEALPKQQLLTMLVAPPPPPPPPPAAPEVVKTVRAVQTEIVEGQLRTPTRIPEKIAMIKEEQPPPVTSGAGVIGGVPGGIPGGQIGGVLGGIIASTSSAVVKPKAETPIRIRVSQGVSTGRLINKRDPVYPKIARDARVQGSVVLAAIIAKDGSIQDLHVLSGHPMLVQAALDAVRQWRYKPYLLNEEPVEVETTVTVIFSLTAG